MTDATPTTADELTDDELLAAFAKWQQLRRFADRTIYARERTIRRILKDTESTLRTLSEELVEEYFLGNLDKLAPKTVHAYLSSVKSFYDWAMRKGHCSADPTVAVPRPRLPTYLPKPVRPHDAQRALDETTHELHVWLLLMGLAGLRCAEVAAIQWEDIYVETLDDGSERWWLRVFGKGDKEREVPLHRRIRAAIEEHTHQHRTGYMFRRPTGQPWPPSAVSAEIGRAMKALDIPVSAHQWRHAFGSAYYRLTKDIYETGKALGHSDIKNTTIYAALDSDSMAENIELIDIEAPRSSGPLRVVPTPIERQARR